MNLEVEIQGAFYPVEVVKKKTNKNTYIRIKDDCTIYVTTNIFTSKKEILRLLQQSEKEILRMIEKQQVKKKNNDGFFYLGKHYDVVFTSSNVITFGDHKVFVGKDIDLDKWYKKQAKILFQEHLDYCYQNFSRKIPYPKLRIRKMTSRWGVCNYKDIVVTLNLELMKRDLSCLDYVIYHELSHLVEANHSAKFWKVVEENCPDYKKIRRTMKNY